MMWLVVLYLVIPGLHWECRCIPPIDNVIIEMMYVPRADLQTGDLTDAQVDSLLNAITQKAATKSGFMCKRLKRHISEKHIEESKHWPVQQYDPHLGWFRWHEFGPLRLYRWTYGTAAA